MATGAMRASIIISTYNSPQWLQKVIWGYECQDCDDFELLIADDGSNKENVELTRAMIAASPLTIRHLWQEDDGFQKWRIVNQAIAKASSDYLIITDGDCIPHSCLVNAHLSNRNKGTFISGSYSKLPMKLSEAISRKDITSGNCFSVPWLLKNGMGVSSNILKIGLVNTGLDRFFNHITPAKRTFNGNNSSCYREDALKINGFDERIQYGGGDREFGYRLEYAGIKPLCFRYSAPCIHLDHPRGYKDAGIRTANEKIIANTHATRASWTEYGIAPSPASQQQDTASTNPG